MTPEELDRLVGHRFPGGTYRVAHWENWLLTDCTGREQLPDGLVHPIVLFHAPILGAGTSIAELFRLGGVDAVGGAVGLLGYDWEYMTPLREDVEYRVDGGVVSAERHTSGDGGPNAAIADHVAFQIELSLDGALVARVTNRWVFRRTAAQVPRPVRGPGSADPDPQPSEFVGAREISPWEMPSVDAARMRTMAALLRDPYPVHWDRAANEALGLGGRVINQGPLNLGYIANMLMAWAGPTAIRRLTVAFTRPVLDTDRVVAGGSVRQVTDGVALCDIWLSRGDERVVTGTADVATTKI